MSEVTEPQAESAQTSLPVVHHPDDPLGQDALETNKRNLIDEDVLAWVTTGHTEGKVITPNLIRQKAYEIGRQYDPYFKASINWYNKWKKKYNYEESPEADALKHKKRSYTAAFKLYAVQRANELLSVSQASLELNVSRRCLQRWKEEIDVISKVAEQASNAVYRRPGQGRKVSDSSLDTRLLEWLEESWKDNEQVTSALIRQKARELSSNQDFKASLGWFVKWQKRHNIDLKERTMDSPLKEKKEGDPSSLRLRLLPEGQEIVYSERSTLSRKRKRDFDGATIQGDEEFDRLLLTWLVERWEAGLAVNEKMLRDRALELNTNQDFRPSKNWLLDWKSRYNVSLEDHTYGNAGESEGEIVEESQVFDEVTLQDNPLTPTKEEAATALASLASEDPNGVSAGGLEIAQALQKLASAFGLTQGGSKSTLAEQLQLSVPQVTAATNSSTLSSVLSPSVPTTTTTYLLENGEVQVGAEEVISEEVVTDEPVVVLETTGDQVGVASLIASANYPQEQVKTLSSSIEFSPPPPKIAPMGISERGGMDSTGMGLLTTLATSHFTTETCNSSNCSTLPMDQFIATTLAVAGPQQCSSGTDTLAATVATDIIDDMLSPSTSDKLVVNQEGVVEIEPSVAIETEVVISEPMVASGSGEVLNVVSTGSGEGLGEPMVVKLVSTGSGEEGMAEPIVILLKGEETSKDSESP